MSFNYLSVFSFWCVLVYFISLFLRFVFQCSFRHLIHFIFLFIHYVHFPCGTLFFPFPSFFLVSFLFPFYFLFVLVWFENLEKHKHFSFNLTKTDFKLQFTGSAILPVQLTNILKTTIYSKLIKTLSVDLYSRYLCILSAFV